MDSELSHVMQLVYVLAVVRSEPVPVIQGRMQPFSVVLKLDKGR